jgi:hypothetical protein
MTRERRITGGLGIEGLSRTATPLGIRAPSNPAVPSVDSREQLRRDCHEDLRLLHEDLTALRMSGVDERTYRTIERISALILKYGLRLDRIETGSFSAAEAPTAPEVEQERHAWSSKGVIDALKSGKPDEPK